jgi:hypothetical protein
MIGSVLQSHLTQRKVSGVRDNERAQEASASQRQNQAADEKDNTIDTSDEDTQVSPDGHGTGGQGRAFSSGEEAPPHDPADQADDHHDDGGMQHIDIQV